MARWRYATWAWPGRWWYSCPALTKENIDASFGIWDADMRLSATIATGSLDLSSCWVLWICAMFVLSCFVMFFRVLLCSIVYCLCLPLSLLGRPVGTYRDRYYILRLSTNKYCSVIPSLPSHGCTLRLYEQTGKCIADYLNKRLLLRSFTVERR